MNMLSVLSLREDVDLWANRPCSNLGQLSLDMEGKAAELLDVDGSAGSNVLVQVLYKSFPDDQVLGFWL